MRPEPLFEDRCCVLPMESAAKFSMGRLQVWQRRAQPKLRRTARGGVEPTTERWPRYGWVELTGEEETMFGRPVLGVTRTIVINSLNAAPVLNGANDLTPISEDAFNNGGTLVADLISTWVTDADSGALEGIAVIGVDNTNGSWEFSIDGGTSWTAVGSPSTNEALLLAADAQTYVRFVPDPNWNGTVTNGITFHAWDQTSGINGDTVDLGLSVNLRDQFDVVSYANDDGSAVWTSDWIESNDNDDAASGNIRIASGALHLDNQDGGSFEAITRAADLSAAAGATLTFDYDGYGAGGLDTIGFETGKVWYKVKADESGREMESHWKMVHSPPLHHTAAWSAAHKFPQLPQFCRSFCLSMPLSVTPSQSKSSNRLTPMLASPWPVLTHTTLSPRLPGT